MSMEQFSLRGSKQMSQQQSPEEVRQEEHRMEQTSEPKTEQPEQQVEQKEEKATLEARYDRLEAEAWGIKQEREITFSMARMQIEGLQTLVSEYGADKVFDIAKKLRDQGDVSALEIVRVLEPDKAKRAALYDKMLGDTKRKAEEFEKRWQMEDSGEHDYFASMWGGEENFYRNAEGQLETLKKLDSFLGKFSVGQAGALQKLDTHHYMSRIVDTYKDDEAKFKQELEQAGNDIFQLVEQRAKVTDGRTEKLRAESDQLIDELSNEIQRVTTELNAKLEEYRARVVSDIGKVGNLETASEEMHTVLQGVLSKVEGEIITRVEATKKEIAEKTAPLRQMMDRAASLHRI